MRITFFVPRCTPDNSHGRYVIELAKRFGVNHEVSVHSGAFSHELRAKANCVSIPIPNRPALLRIVSLWASSPFLARLTRADITHVNGADAPVGNVVTAHCCNAVMRAKGERSSPFHGANYALGAWAERYTFSKPGTRRVIAVSRTVQEEIEREYRIQPSQIVCVHHGVDSDTFTPNHPDRERVRKDLGVTQDDFLVLFVGGDYRIKGLLTLLESAARIGRPLTILGVGVSPDAELTSIIRRNHYDGLCRLVGRTPEIARFTELPIALRCQLAMTPSAWSPWKPWPQGCQ